MRPALTLNILERPLCVQAAQLYLLMGAALVNMRLPQACGCRCAISPLTDWKGCSAIC
jgi:hypothetical protein